MKLSHMCANSNRQLYKASEILFEGERWGGGGYFNLCVISFKCVVPLVMFNSLNKAELVCGKSIFKCTVVFERFMAKFRQT